MREIKVRGWSEDPLVNGTHWITADDEYHEIYINRAEKSAYINGHEVVYGSVSQYTGIKDKNGREIYEGDIIRRNIHRDGVNPCYITDVVAYCDGAFGTKMANGKVNNLELVCYSSYEVIGNIFEHSHLLEQQHDN